MLVWARLEFGSLEFFDIIILFVEGNDLYFDAIPTTISANRVAHQDYRACNDLLCLCAKLVYVFGTPERNENKVRSKKVNFFLQSVDERRPKDQSHVTWLYRTVSRHITRSRYFNKTKDATRLNEDCLSNLRKLIKEKPCITNTTRSKTSLLAMSSLSVKMKIASVHATTCETLQIFL